MNDRVPRIRTGCAAFKHVAQKCARFCGNDMRENKELKRKQRI
jgi:hypothetical protein